MTYFAVNELAMILLVRPQPIDQTTYPIPEVPVPARLLALVLCALGPSNSISRDTEHLSSTVSSSSAGTGE